MDALLAVADGFSSAARPEHDLETLELELLVADRDHVERRLERVEKQAKSGDPALRKEVDELRTLLAHLDGGRSLARLSAELPEALDPLTTMPLLAIVNGPAGIDLALEAELAELPDEEAAAFRDGRSALDEIVRRLTEALDLITFFTAGEKETRAWTLRRGRTALDAAGTIHSRHRPRLHPLRGDPLGRAARRRARTPRRRGGDSSGSRGRRTPSRTATCSTSVSTCEGGGPVTGPPRVMACAAAAT